MTFNFINEPFSLQYTLRNTFSLFIVLSCSTFQTQEEKIQQPLPVEKNSKAGAIWGVLAGKVLIKSVKNSQKIITLVAAGLIGLILGFGLDILNITPIIKKISTSSFTLASGGWILLMLAFLYWLVDIKKWNRYAWVFVVVGMNSIFIYILFSTAGYNFLNKAVGLFPRDILAWLGASANIQALFAALATLFVEWYICYWLYKRKIFFKL